MVEPRLTLQGQEQGHQMRWTDERRKLEIAHGNQAD
jgi:hypothetical protein